MYITERIILKLCSFLPDFVFSVIGFQCNKPFKTYRSLNARNGETVRAILLINERKL